MPDLVGKNLGKYQILECIGHGGMAEVYRAFQPGLDRVVAIKVVHSFLSRDENFLARFRREAQAVADLRHPNIVQVYDFDVFDDRPFMVLEYIDGVTLGNIIDLRLEQKKTLEISEILWLMQGLSSAVSYAHRQGIVHRDITPANVMLTSDGRVILTDFGLVRILGGMKFTATGQITGTPEYMSPEQAHGAPGDQRSDLYSLGIVLYEAITGRVPYNGETPVSVLLKHVSFPVPLVRDINPDIPPPFDSVVSKALAKKPEDRYQTGDEFWEALCEASPDDEVVPASVETPLSLRPMERRITTMKRITPVPIDAHIPPPTQAPPTVVTARPEASGTHSVGSSATWTIPAAPTPPSPGSNPDSSSSSLPLFSIDQVSVLTSQILKSMESTKEAGISESAAAHRALRGSHTSLITMPSINAETTEPIASRFRKSMSCAAIGLAAGTAIVIGSAMVFQAGTGESVAAFWRTLSTSADIFEPKTFSLQKALPRTFAFAVLTLFTLSVPGLVFGGFYRSASRIWDFFLNVLGYLFVASLTIFCYNALMVFQSVSVPVVQFTLTGTATYRQFVAIATFNPVLPSLQTARFNGELKQATIKAYEDQTLTEAQVQRVINECLQPSLVTSTYLGAWSLGYVLLLSVTMGSSMTRGRKGRLFFSIVGFVGLSFLLFVAQSSIPQNGVIREIDTGILPFLIADNSVASMKHIWLAILAGSFLTGLFASPPEKKKEATKTNVSFEVNIPS